MAQQWSWVAVLQHQSAGSVRSPAAGHEAGAGCGAVRGRAGGAGLGLGRERGPGSVEAGVAGAPWWVLSSRQFRNWQLS